MKSNIEEIKKINLSTFAANILSDSHEKNSQTLNLNENFFVGKLDDTYFNGVLSQSFISNFYTIYFLKTGYIEQIHQTDTIKIRENEIYFTKPGEVKRWKQLKVSDGYIVAFSLDYLLSLIDYKRLEKIIVRLIEKPIRKIKLHNGVYRIIPPIFENLLSEFNNPTTHSKELTKIRLLELLIHSSRIQGKDGQENPIRKIRKSADHAYHRFIQLLEENHHQIINGEEEQLMRVSDFALVLNMNPTYLSDCVKKASGRSAKKHINERLLILAKCQLMHTSLTISEISYRLRFESASYFIRFFKKFEMVTPQRFRRENLLI